MTVNEYRELYLTILGLADDADGFGLFNSITEEDIEKCKCIFAIMEVMSDVPMRRMRHIFGQKNIEFDYDEFLNKIDEYEESKEV